ncbi:MAG: hypothetical protein IPM40_19875 [Gammaproteobacteria bacterium]|nr:hypothetical protein [Gammaproteobacteria bacterium]
MFIEPARSRSILMMAMMAAEAGEVLAPVSATKTRIGRAMRHPGREAIPLHGGIRITDELDVGHCLKRLGDRDPVREHRLSPATFWSIS